MDGKRLFLIVPKIAHPWYDEVRKGADAQARALSDALGVAIEVDLMPPATAGVAEQNAMLDEAARRAPDGIALDLQHAHLQADQPGLPKPARHRPSQPLLHNHSRPFGRVLGGRRGRRTLPRLGLRRLAHAQVYPPQALPRR